MPQTIVAGATAGLLELLIMYPLDVVKTRMQLAASGTKSVSVAGSLKSIVAEGGVSRLYRGIGAPAIQEPIKRSFKFTGNAMYSKMLPGDNIESRFASGMMAGMTECVAIAPFEVVKIRMQATNRLNAYKSVSHCAKTILSTEGALGFFQGIETALWRSGTWSGCYFSSIWFLKKGPLNIEDEQAAGKPTVMARNFACGLVGGTIGTIVNNPFDVVVSRMRNVLPGEATPYKFSLQSLQLIAKEEGAGALYKGFGAKVLRLGPGGGIMMMAFDVAKSLMLE